MRREPRADRRRTRQERRLRREENEDCDAYGDRDGDNDEADNGEADNGVKMAKAGSFDETESASGSESTDEIDSDGSVNRPSTPSADSTRNARRNKPLKAQQNLMSSRCTTKVGRQQAKAHASDLGVLVATVERRERQ